MGLMPVVASDVNTKTCEWCGGVYPLNMFPVSNSIFDRDGKSRVCFSCLEKYLKEKDYIWNHIQKVCQFLDIPFVPKTFEEIKKDNEDTPFTVYTNFLWENKYDTDLWSSYYEAFLALKENGKLESEVPLVHENNRAKLQKKWGPYCDEDLEYLENLLSGIQNTQNISGVLQQDQALKICRISLDLDSKIRNGENFDKLLSSYDKLVRTAEFTPKNVKNVNDFDSVGELVLWLEKRGFKNMFYDNVSRDIVDETIKNIQNYNQRLYINESNIGDEITQRLESLKNIAEMENYYDLEQNYDIDEYDNSGFEELLKQDDGEFQV